MRLQDVKIKGLGAGILGAAALGLLLSASGSARAQEGRDDAKPPQQAEPKQDEAKPREQEAPKDVKPPREQEPAKGEEARPAKNDAMKPEKAQDRPQENRGGDHHAAPAAQGRRIPDQKFHASFGREHTFHVQKTVIVEGQPRFQYSGFWFSLAQSWPVGWDYNDNCYIDYIDGEYVLIDLLHPGVQIVLVVVG